MSSIAENLQAVARAIVAAARNAGREPREIRLLAVSKTFGADAVIEAMAAGQTAFGENYLQEALDKMAELGRIAPELQPEWHFIGPIQSNKTRLIAEHFAWVHSVDRFKIAQRLSDQRPSHLPPLNICLQVNISGEASKSGATPEEVPALAQQVALLPGLKLRGLMAIPEPAEDEAAQRAPFRQLRELAEALRAQGIAIDTLSMGMSADMAAAIAEGATMVRIGTAIFGKRDYAN
ncbi:YggS family pyridoxal phosphate-dependent enzyme [Noviherbaspirillum pedocola]|uniref:Pyridoxal phosphate homeostasis protein n=1 Tax=Noviherbaspirillum pedocola TaxID=2801341 RepID=A0A934SYY9_9BURK|nr:YggS family pyridoxal phosphate-dependent enzyme [Noviherbaspirillum pedocola]MBK4738244.1 YggS family pyridoxal phosphate-dependent enzyme [Noviherbaspirillum pedocola]